MSNYPSLKSEILELPEPERTNRKELYTPDEWRNCWELNAWPHQLEPTDPEWRVWTVIGPPKTGKTLAGRNWVIGRFLSRPGIYMCIVGDGEEVDFVNSLISRLHPTKYEQHSIDKPLAIKITIDSGHKIYIAPAASWPELSSQPVQYLWADDVVDAEDIINTSWGGIRRYVFTNPTRLAPGTEVSRAGDKRP